MKDSMKIRLEKQEEHREVENLVRESFWNVYRPGCLEHYVLNQLRKDPAFIPELDLVMELDGKIIGQNMFMKAEIKADDGRSIPIMTMGPICITPELKCKGKSSRTWVWRDLYGRNCRGRYSNEWKRNCFQVYIGCNGEQVMTLLFQKKSHIMKKTDFGGTHGSGK